MKTIRFFLIPFIAALLIAAITSLVQVYYYNMQNTTLHLWTLAVIVLSSMSFWIFFFNRLTNVKYWGLRHNKEQRGDWVKSDQNLLYYSSVLVKNYRIMYLVAALLIINTFTQILPSHYAPENEIGIYAINFAISFVGAILSMMWADGIRNEKKEGSFKPWLN